MSLPEEMLTKVWLLPAIMAGSFLVILLVGKRLPEKGRALVGIASVGVCFVLALVTAFGWIQRVDSDDAGPVACGEARYQAPILEGIEEHGDVGEGDHGGEAEPATAGEEAAGLSVGESAAPAAPAAAEEGEGGEEEHHSTPPVVCAVTWFETGLDSWPVQADAQDEHGGDDEHAADGALTTFGADEGEGGGGADGDGGGLAPTPIKAEVEDEQGPGLFEFGFITAGLSVMMLITVRPGL